MIQTAFNGLCMAIADSVPGVSGGTIAFILGFYDRFIEALHDLFGESRENRKSAFVYLFKLGVGWAPGMGLCALLLSNLFTKYIYFMSSLFLGLTVASIPFIIIAEKGSLQGKLQNFPFAIAGVVLVITLSLLRNSAGAFGNINFLHLQLVQFVYIFLAGMVAITAMVLPGISGSTVLLIAGVYLPTISAVKELLHFNFMELPGLFALGLGILFGIRVSIGFIRTARKKYCSQTMYLIIGLMIGSLFAIIMGPTTLSTPVPALDASTFHIWGFVAGVEVLMGLEYLKEKISGQEAHH